MWCGEHKKNTTLKPFENVCFPIMNPWTTKWYDDSFSYWTRIDRFTACTVWADWQLCHPTCSVLTNGRKHLRIVCVFKLIFFQFRVLGWVMLKKYKSFILFFYEYRTCKIVHRQRTKLTTHTKKQKKCLFWPYSEFSSPVAALTLPSGPYLTDSVKTIREQWRNKFSRLDARLMNETVR